MISDAEIRCCFELILPLIKWRDLKNFSLVNKMFARVLKPLTSRQTFVKYRFAERHLRLLRRNYINRNILSRFSKITKPSSISVKQKTIPRNGPDIVQNIVIYTDCYDPLDRYYLTIVTTPGSNSFLYCGIPSRVDKLGSGITYALYFYLETYFYNVYSSPYWNFDAELKRVDGSEVPFTKMLVSGLTIHHEQMRKFYKTVYLEVPNKTPEGWYNCYYDMGDAVSGPMHCGCLEANWKKCLWEGSCRKKFSSMFSIK
jgi:hypothetical protein